MAGALAVLFSARAVRHSARPVLPGVPPRAGAARLDDGLTDLAFEMRGVVQDAFVDRAELFDPEVGVGDALAAAAAARGRRHQRVEHVGDDGAGDVEMLAERRM